MVFCSRCGKLGHVEVACHAAGVATLSSSSVLASADLGGSGAYALTAASYADWSEISQAEGSAARSLRLLKTQLHLAVGQREEDPERAWLELVSIRDRLGEVVERTKDDPLLAADVEQFRGRLADNLSNLMHDVGDETIAPLYSWVDLLRQRVSLEQEVETARTRVAEARAARGLRSSAAPATETQARAAITAAEEELAAWKADAPPPPPPQAVEGWQRAGGDALRACLSVDPTVVRSRGREARSTFAHLPVGGSRLAVYARSRTEHAVLAICAVSALAAAAAALLGDNLGTYLGWVAAASVILAGAVGLSLAARRRADTERRATVDCVWHHTVFTEYVAALTLEVGWLRALAAAARAQSAFDARAGEGGQLAELARWRPDLEPSVAEAARSSLVASTAARRSEPSPYEACDTPIHSAPSLG
jgi:hypothetical protein